MGEKTSLPLLKSGIVLFSLQQLDFQWAYLPRTLSKMYTLGSVGNISRRVFQPPYKELPLNHTELGVMAV